MQRGGPPVIRVARSTSSDVRNARLIGRRLDAQKKRSGDSFANPASTDAKGVWLLCDRRLAGMQLLPSHGQRHYRCRSVFALEAMTSASAPFDKEIGS